MKQPLKTYVLTPIFAWPLDPDSNARKVATIAYWSFISWLCYRWINPTGLKRAYKELNERVEEDLKLFHLFKMKALGVKTSIDIYSFLMAEGYTILWTEEEIASVAPDHPEDVIRAHLFEGMNNG